MPMIDHLFYETSVGVHINRGYFNGFTFNMEFISRVKISF